MVSLVIIFNHKFNKNIPLLKRLYKNRFSNIIFIVPFYGGDDPQVVPVYESSYQFQGYIAQAYSQLSNIECSHFVFIGDDLILNPVINENNILEYLNLRPDDAFIGSIRSLKSSNYWGYIRFYDASNALKGKGVNYKTEIPDINYAEKKAREFGVEDYKIYKKVYCKATDCGNLKGKIQHIYTQQIDPVKIEYPLMTGYSDFFVIPSEKLQAFSRLSGVFAAMNLFVEIAIPTTLMLIMDKEHLKLQTDTEVLTPAMWLQNETATNFERDCNFVIENMKEHWPENYLYLHPIKLSRWKYKGE